MLPGFRFLFAAILLSTSILVFGLGAAALLRATHEQYVTNPSWRNGPQEQMFAQASEPAQPVLSALRAEAEAEPAPSLRDQVPTIGLPASEPEQVALVTTETNAQPEPQVTEAAPATEVAKAEAAVTDTLTPADTIAVDNTATAAVSEPASSETNAALASSALDIASAKVAALNDPATTALKDPPAKAKADAKAASSAPESKTTKPRAKAKKRHRVVRRPPPPVQQTYDPFAPQQQPALAATATARARQ
ncbi:hypothetical protein GWG65_14905 [Bradyrhizobium sp. CSA207]|uniref:hypothetical protein n=1 Tax=Bradyrhizobium sp. CSA207 TaxID=2698826 RepID=UPI0023B11D14|nr:hypothetical protein [Bradyrhizobium sp. CSA207]MDE5442716.1 hypothetical protein [Bradyrhizobium sp. CSA207]